MYESSWVYDELSNVAIKDKRLVNRLIKTAVKLAEHPHCSIPEACGKWAEAKGTYRLLNNPKLSPEAVIMSHRQQTIRRMKGHKIVLDIQDTTSLDYADHPCTEGLGLYSTSEDSKGILLHTSLAVSVTGVSFGLLSQKFWTRDPEERGKKHNRHKSDTKDKESQRWLDSLDSSLKDIPSDIKVVTVCDREADIYDFFNKAVSEGKDLLIRVAQNRKIEEEHKYLIPQIESSSIAGETIVNIPRNIKNKRPSREARLSIKFCPVTIKPPKNRKDAKALSSLQLYAILAEEINPPEGVEPVYWLLLTTLPIETAEDAIEKIAWYTQRWKIERFHYILKTGCQVEELQLETFERLKNAIAIYSVIAWRLLWLTYEARENPDAPCDTVLQEHEWNSLYCMVNKTPIPPKTPPNLKEAVLLIAKLGGFLARKSDGEPGVVVLWRGMQRLNDISQLWLITHPSP